MTLTPVPIRGKRKRNRTTPLNRPPMALHHQQEHQDELPSKHQKTKHSLLTILAMRQSRCATLESLPMEVLESIFLYSSNISLPRASPILGAKLSGKITRLRIFIWAFHDTWDQWFGIPTSEEVVYGPKVQHVLSWSQVAAGDPALQVYIYIPPWGSSTSANSSQSTVLALPWVDIDFILQAQQIWADTYAKDRWYQHCVPSRQNCGFVTDHDFEGGFGHFNARKCFDNDYAMYKTWYFPLDYGIDWHARDVHPLTRIPTELITGPWDEERQRRLFWLIRGGATIGPPAHAPLSWEVKLECVRNAVIDAPTPSEVVGNLLFNRFDSSSWGISGIPGDVVRVEVRKLERRMDGADSRLKDALFQTKRLLESS